MSNGNRASGHQKEQSKTEDTQRMGTIIGPSMMGDQSHRWRVSFHTSHMSGTIGPEETFECTYMSQDAPFKGFGKTGARYKNGQQVYCTRANDTQEWVIIGAVPNSVGEGGMTDPDHQRVGSHPEGMALHGTGPKCEDISDFMREAINTGPLQRIDAVTATNLKAEFGPGKIIQNTGQKTDMIKDNETRTKRLLKECKEEGRYAPKGQQQQVNKSIGAWAFANADMVDPGKAIQKLVGKQGELIPNALQMIQNLKNHVQSGAAGVPALNAVGGGGLVSQALAGAASARSGQSEPKKKEEDPLEKQLCEEFKKAFPGQECTVASGENTPAFEAWKKDFMLTLRLQQGIIS